AKELDCAALNYPGACIRYLICRCLIRIIPAAKAVEASVPISIALPHWKSLVPLNWSGDKWRDNQWTNCRSSRAILTHGIDITPCFDMLHKVAIALRFLVKDKIPPHPYEWITALYIRREMAIVGNHSVSVNRESAGRVGCHNRSILHIRVKVNIGERL